MIYKKEKKKNRPRDSQDRGVDGGLTGPTPLAGAGPHVVDLVSPRQPPPAGPPRPGTVQGFGGLLPREAPSRSPAPSNCRARLVMINQPLLPNQSRPAPLFKLLAIVQHNFRGIWNVFLFLFESFKATTTYPSVVLLQDPAVHKAHFGSFNGFVPFSPPIWKPWMAAYIQRSFLSHYSVHPRFKEVDDVIPLDLSCREPIFGNDFHCFQIINLYSTNLRVRRVRSIPPETLSPYLGVPLLVVGDLNIHNPLSDPLPSFSVQEIPASDAYCQMAAEAGFALLNPRGEYTRFPPAGKARSSVIDLAFANPLLLPMVTRGESSVPSPASDHIPITIIVVPPTLNQQHTRPRWGNTDWETLSPIIRSYEIPPPECAPPLRNWTRGCRSP